MTGKHGTYSCPRKCDKCEYETTDRDAYWQHVLAHDKAPFGGKGPVTLPAPYYDDGQVTIYHGDCRELLLAAPRLHPPLLRELPPLRPALAQRAARPRQSTGARRMRHALPRRTATVSKRGVISGKGKAPRNPRELERALASSIAEPETDVRGEARLIDTVMAIQLVLESRGLNANATRLLNMIEWLLENETDLEPNGTVPTRLFIEAIKESRV